MEALGSPAQGLIELYGKPEALRLENGLEFTASAFEDWCRQRRIERRFIEPGKPDRNAFIEPSA